MALVGKLDSTVHIKLASEKFFNILSNQIHQCPTASPGNIQAVSVHEGDWETSGSIKLWEYVIDGKSEIFKEKIDVDEANKKISMTAVGGHILDQFKSYKIILQVEEGSVHVALEFEKLNADIPPPNKYLDFVVNVVKDIDAHLLKP